MPFTGETAEIVVGTQGLTGSKNTSRIGPGHLLVARNVSFTGGNVRKEGGSAKYNSSVITGAPQVLGGHDWFPSSGVQRMVVLLSDGTLKKDSGAGTFPTTLASGLSVTDCVPVFVDGGAEQAALSKKLFIFTGLNQLKVLIADGVTASDVATPAADWATKKPKAGCIHENRLWVAAGHMLYYSLPTNHEDFTAAGTGNLNVYPGQGDEIIGVISFKSLLVVFKAPTGIYIVDTSDPTIANWSVRKISQSVGAISPRGFTQIDNDIAFMSHGGSVHLLSAVQQFGDIEDSSLSQISDIDEFVRRNLNGSQFKFTQCIYYEEKREIHFTVSKFSSTSRDGRLVVDLSDAELARFRFSDKDVNKSLWLRADINGLLRPVSGDESGFVWLLDQDNLAYDGAGYPSQFQTPHLDFAHLDPKLGTIKKIGKFLELIADPTGNSIVNVNVLWDDVIKQSISFNLSIAGAALGSFVLGTDALAGDKIVNKRKRLIGSGRRLSLIFSNNSAGQDFPISRAYLHFKRGGESESQP